MDADDLISEALQQFYAHVDKSIAYNLRLGYRGDLWCWMEVGDGKLTFHAARKPPIDESGRFASHTLKFDLSDDAKAREFFAEEDRIAGDRRDERGRR